MMPVCGSSGEYRAVFQHGRCAYCNGVGPIYQADGCKDCLLESLRSATRTINRYRTLRDLNADSKADGPRVQGVA